ncbi:MAG: hypothetical protein KF819_38605 [Labilithrix sp.]|nr:hypothetical protein [Labilithrix sp.]
MPRAGGLVLVLVCSACSSPPSGSPLPSDGGVEAALPEGECADDLVERSMPLPSKGTVSAMAAGDAALFYADFGGGPHEAGGLIGSIDTCGGSPRVIAREQAAPFGLAASGGTVCWSNIGTNVGGRLLDDGSVQCNAGGSTIIVVRDVNGPGAVATDGGAVAFILDFAVHLQGLRSGPPAKLYTSDGGVEAPADLRMDATSVFFTTGTDAATGGALRVVPRDGGEARIVAEGRIGTLELDATHVYFTDRSTAVLRRVAKSGGAATALANVSLDGAIAVDERHVYFKDLAQRLARIPKEGGAVESVRASSVGRALALAAGHVYWDSGGVFWRVRKP